VARRAAIRIAARAIPTDRLAARRDRRRVGRDIAGGSAQVERTQRSAVAGKQPLARHPFAGDALSHEFVELAPTSRTIGGGLNWWSEIPSCICMHIYALFNHLTNRESGEQAVRRRCSDQFSGLASVLNGDPTPCDRAALACRQPAAVACGACRHAAVAPLLALNDVRSLRFVVLLNELMGCRGGGGCGPLLLFALRAVGRWHSVSSARTGDRRPF